MKKTTILMLIAATAVSACANRPDAVRPAGVNASLYTDKTCQQLLIAKNSVDEEVADLSVQQNNAANGDAIGVFLLGIPTSSLTGGDVEGELAAAKGQQQSIKQALQFNGCF